MSDSELPHTAKFPRSVPILAGAKRPLKKVIKRANRPHSCWEPTCLTCAAQMVLRNHCVEAGGPTFVMLCRLWWKFGERWLW